MKNIYRFLMKTLAVGMAGALSGCSAPPPDSIRSLECVQTTKGRICYREQSGFAVFDGDMVLGPVEKVRGMSASGGRGAYAYTLDLGRTWPGGEMPYVIGSSAPNQNDILEAVRIINAQTHFRLVPRTNQKDYVKFQASFDPNACYSHLGRVGGEQEIWITPGCKVGSILHEVGHAMGLIHEHQRPDRDQFVSIHWQNVLSDRRSAFDIQQYAGSQALGPYDVDSIMHYYSFAFSRSSQPTITRRDGSHIPYPHRFSSGDISGINRIAANGPPPGTTRRISGDSDGDGRDDLFLITSRGEVWVQQSTGANFSLRQVYRNWGWREVFRQGSQARFFAGDFNGDGRSDIAFTWPNGNIHIGIMYPDGVMRFRTAHSNSAWGHVYRADSMARFLSGDFNGDGRMDIAFTWPNGNIHLGFARADGTLQFNTASSIPGWGQVYSASSHARFFVGDFNGDRRDDIAFTWPNGNIHVGFAQANGTLAFRIVSSIPGWGPVYGATSAARFFAADFNGDGRTDLAFTWPNGNIHLGFMQPNGTMAFNTASSNPAWGGIYRVGSETRFFAGDFDGDGRADLAFTWINGSIHIGYSQPSGRLLFKQATHQPNWGGVFAASSPAKFLTMESNGDRRVDLFFHWVDRHDWVGLSDGDRLNFRFFGVAPFN